MKKILGLLLTLILLLTGCSNDEGYINTVKSITFPDGQTVEQYVENNIKAGEMYKLNNVNIFMNEGMLFVLSFGGKNEVLYTLKQTGVTLPENISSTTWVVEGETKAGKVVVASNDNIIVKMETVKDGDYVKIDSRNIFTYDKSNNKLIPQEELDTALELYNLAEKYGYTNPQPEKEQEEYKRFDEQEVLKNEEGLYTLEYYPSGRVKYLSDDIALYLELEDRSYIKDIAELIVGLDSEIEKYTDESINKLVDFSIDLEYEIIAEKLNKKITNDEKKQIQKLEERANKVLDKLQRQVDKINNY